MSEFGRAAIIVAGCAAMAGPPAAPAADGKPDALIAAMLGDTPVVGDLRELTDRIGGRATGSAANEAAVEWALATLREAGVRARAEEFRMPMQWQEATAAAEIGGGAAYRPDVLAKPFSIGTSPGGLRAPLADGGTGSAADFERLGNTARGAWLAIETSVLDDEVGLSGLFSVVNGAGHAAHCGEFGDELLTHDTRCRPMPGE